MTRRRRRLSPEEERLWKRVAETASPIKKDRPATGLQDVRLPPKDDPAETFRVPKFRVGEAAAPISTGLTPRPKSLKMDQKLFSKMRRGKSSPEARIDLHGMTVDVAHSALTGFLMRAHSEGHRLVLVITGKGKTVQDDGPIPRRVGVLRQQLPRWLEVPPLRQIVLDWSPAHIRHGGSGAFYVYLRR